MKYFEEVDELVKKIVPPKCEVTKVGHEGPEIVLYTKNPRAFFEDESIVRRLAGALKKHINIRTDKSLLTDPVEAEAKIRKIVSDDAEITFIKFDPVFSEVVIEAKKLGVVIGKNGSVSKQITLETGWTSNIKRAPTTECDMIRHLRFSMIKESKNRKKILEDVAKRIYREPKKNTKDWIRLEFLGGYQEVGRSCMLLRTPESKVMIDCGINIGNPNEAYPYLDALDFPLSELDAVIISHAHLDHSGFLPYLYAYGYEGPVYCSAPTRDLMSLLHFDALDIATKEGKDLPFSEKHIKEVVKHTLTRNFGEVTDITPDVRMTLYNAGHILGSSSVHLHIGNGAHNLVYSGDIKYGYTKLFEPADNKGFPRVETLILESTYGGKNDIQTQRKDCDEDLIRAINKTLKKGGFTLIPVFAVGRGQEVMLVLEEAFKREKFNAPVYIDGMTKQASAIHTIYPEFLKSNIERRVLHNDSPFTSEIFQEIRGGKEREEIMQNGKPGVILASSGMLTGGPSLEYLKMLAADSKNQLIFVGYQGEGTLGKKIQRGKREIPIGEENGRTKTVEINLHIETIDGFSGHSDRKQLLAYIRKMRSKPKLTIIDHGDRQKCLELSNTIRNTFKIDSTSPKNLEIIRLR
ncbi:MAG: beta-CASP ribonuclease aCPSF1 [Candidatus Diapherotrites archaeon]|nr:beta-CASP ribonuclease aCPSF1 [Candidatus Diapherotrites archaeon]